MGALGFRALAVGEPPLQAPVGLHELESIDRIVERIRQLRSDEAKKTRRAS